MRAAVARRIAGVAASLLAIAAAPAPDWIEFHTASLGEKRLVYSYDPASVALTGGKLFVRGRMVGLGGTTVFEISIDCARDTFTEVSTVVTEDNGAVRRVPDKERFTDYPLPADSSGEKLRTMFCKL